jgi:hypothetical protein
MTMALSFWGMYQGVWNTVLETIYADSITTGNRSDFNTRKFMLLQAASVVGPLIALCLFLYEGDTWYHMTLRLVFIVGVSLCVPAAIMLFFFNDDKALGDESEAVSVAPSRNSGAETPVSRQISGRGAHGSTINGVDSDKASRALNEMLHSVQTSSEINDGKRRWNCVTSSKIPHVLVFSDLISGLASGMTIKFFPLFFARKVWLSPVAVQSIYIALPAFMIATSFVAQRVSKKIGRVITSIAMAYIGSGALIGLWALLKFKTEWECYDCPWHETTNRTTCEAPRSSDNHSYCSYKVTGATSWTCTPIDCGLVDHWYYVISLYFISTFQHCCRPLKKSILMDYPRKSTRGRWNSLDSVTRFGWSGSAVLGGYIIDRWDYGASFLATGLAQILSASVLFVLLPLLGDDHERSRPVESPSTEKNDSEAEDEDELSPLLPRGDDGRRHKGNVDEFAVTKATSGISIYQ